MYRCLCLCMFVYIDSKRVSRPSSRTIDKLLRTDFTIAIDVPILSKLSALMVYKLVQFRIFLYMYFIFVAFATETLFLSLSFICVFRFNLSEFIFIPFLSSSFLFHRLNRDSASPFRSTEFQLSVR